MITRLLLSVLWLFCLGYPAEAGSLFWDGDIIFQTSRSSQSLAIQRATGSPYTHMGVIFFRNGEPYVLEAIKTVSFTLLKEWIARGEGGKYVVKRLRSAENILTSEAISKMLLVGKIFLGKPYDFYFEWSDDRIYCSELVWKIYDRALGLKIGNLQRFQDLNLSDSIVKMKIRERYGSSPPLQEIIISPAAMFAADEIETVETRSLNRNVKR